MVCPYSYILGVPGEGVHAKRIGGYAFNDILATIIAAAITSYFTGTSFIVSLLVWFTVGEILHYAFGVQTAFLTRIGIDVEC